MMDEDIARAFEDVYAGQGTVYEAGEFARLADELEALGLITLDLDEEDAHSVRAAVRHALVWTYLTPQERRSLGAVAAVLDLELARIHHVQGAAA